MPQLIWRYLYFQIARGFDNPICKTKQQALLSNYGSLPELFPMDWFAKYNAFVATSVINVGKQPYVTRVTTGYRTLNIASNSCSYLTFPSVM